MQKPGIVGHEFDEDFDNGFRPPGLFKLSQTKVQNVQIIQDWGANFDSGTATHTLTIYKSISGSLVFGAGTCQWSWGLDTHHDHDRPHLSNENNIRVDIDQAGTDLNLEQATLNLFADMDDVQPNIKTLKKGLKFAKTS